jgi:hypothetical protein
MAYDAEQMRAHRVATGATASLVIPVRVLASLLRTTGSRSILHNHLGPDLCDAIEKATRGGE